MGGICISLIFYIPILEQARLGYLNAGSHHMSYVKSFKAFSKQFGKHQMQEETFGKWDF